MSSFDIGVPLMALGGITFTFLVVYVCFRKYCARPPVVSHALDEEEMDFKLELDRRGENNREEVFEDFDDDNDAETELDESQIEQLKLLTTDGDDDTNDADLDQDLELVSLKNPKNKKATTALSPTAQKIISSIDLKHTSSFSREYSPTKYSDSSPKNQKE